MMGGKRIRPVLDSRKDEIIAAYENGESIDSLAGRFGCSNTPIRSFLVDNGVAFRPAVRPRVLASCASEVIEMYRVGKSTRQIARTFKVDRNTVSSFLSERGVLRNAPLSERTFFISSSADKGMFAGLLLGEGSIVIRGRGASIRIVNQDTAIIGWLAQFGGRIYWSKPRERSPNPCGIWDLSRAIDVFHCLVSIHPFLLGKKRQLANAALTVLKQNYGLETP